MSPSAISVENLSKAYRIGLKEEIPDTFFAAAMGWMKAPLRNWRRLKRLNTCRNSEVRTHRLEVETLNQHAAAQPSADVNGGAFRSNAESQESHLGNGGAAADHPPAMTRSMTNYGRVVTRNPPSTTYAEEPDLIWALQNVSFQVAEGEVIGIIGRNGAGKSTLLKVLSRITEPTSGRVVIRGRASSLLEVGTGFHPELTGRENIYMNGTTLGMSRREIDRKFDEIVDFSGVGKFLDTPIKRYSSGMQVRLAFSVAAHLEPEILIIDEVLAVGDFEFQKKCLGKMRDVAEGGRTVLFVSHNMAAVSQLCSRALRLDRGRTSDDGSTDAVVTRYLAESRVHSVRGRFFNNESTASDSTLIAAGLMDHRRQPCDRLLFGEPFGIHMLWRNRITIPALTISIRFTGARDQLVTAANTLRHRDQTMPQSGLHGLVCWFEENPFPPGQFWLTLNATIRPHTRIATYPDCLSFQISDAPWDATNPFDISGAPAFALKPYWETVPPQHPDTKRR